MTTSQPDTVNGHKLFTTLDGMRFVAALLAATRHVTPLFGTVSLPESYMAVDLFFLLSGFVIANAYEHKLSNGMDSRTFLRVRAIRLYPVYCLGGVLGVGASLAAADYGSLWRLACHGVLSLLLLPNGLNLLFPLNGPAWTLFLEAAINLVYVVALRWLVGARLVLLIVLAALALIGCVLVRHSFDYGWTLPTLPVGVARVVFSFYLGVLLQRHHARSGANGSTATNGNVVPWLLVACVVAVLSCRLPAVVAPIFELLAVTCIFPCLVLAATRFQPSGISARIFRLGGLASYVIYTVHAPLGALILAVSPTTPAFRVTAYAPWAGIAFLILLVPFCAAVVLFYETPIRNALERKWPARRDARARDPAGVCRPRREG